MIPAIFSSGGVQTVTPQQVVYLDFDGANTAYHGELLTIEGVTVQNSGLTAAQIAALIDQLNESYWGSVRFVSRRPESGDYSTVYIGATDAFSCHGLAETIDIGNQNHSDNAFVNLRGDESLATVRQIISHEVDHLLGTLDHGGDGLAAYAMEYIVSAGVTSTNVTLNYDSMYVTGGTANRTTVNNGHIFIDSGGTANSSVVNNGFIVVSNRGVANYSVMSSGCIIDVNSGATANHTVLNRGSMVVDDSGTANHTSVNSGGSMLLYSGGTANSSTVNAGGSMYISSGGVTNYTAVNSGGSLYISSGATALNLIWTPCVGTINIDNGAYVTFQSNYSGCYLGHADELQSQAAVMSGMAFSGAYRAPGSMCVFSGGTAGNNIVNSSGFMYIFSGGVANSTNLNRYGAMLIYSGGTANDTWLTSGGRLNIYSGGTANNIKTDDGHVSVFSGGITNNAVINDWGGMSIDGGTIDHSIVNGGKIGVYQGVANNTIINSGSMSICSNSVADNTIVYSGGYLYAEYGGVVNNNTLLGGSLMTYSNGVVNHTTVSSEGFICISSGCLLNDTVINTESLLLVVDGGTANDTFSFNSYIVISDSGIMNRTIMDSGGSMTIDSSGGANSTTVSNQAYICLRFGGWINSTTLNHLGSMLISSGCTAKNTVVNSGGRLFISSGGVANNQTVNSGGSLFISSGGKVTGKLTMTSGAVVSAYNGAKIDFNIAGQSPGGYQINDLSLIKGAPGYTVTVSAAQSAGVYKLAQGAGDFNQSLTIGDGTNVFGNLTPAGAMLRYGDYQYYLLPDNGNLRLSVIDKILADPQSPGTLAPAAGVNKYDVTISWQAATPQGKAKIVKYQVYVNGECTVVNSTSLTLKKLQISAGNTVQVRAVDSLGHYGSLSDIITFDIKDVTAPVLSNVTASLDQYTATVRWSRGTDNVGVDRYQVRCGDQTQIVAGTSATFDHLALGVNEVEVTAYDAAGNAGNTVKTRITVKDVTAPDEVTGLADPSLDRKYNATLSWSTGVDNSGSIASYEIKLDNNKVFKSNKTALMIKNLAIGQHSYQVRAIDKNKNIGDWSAAKAFTVLDTTAPGTVSVKAAVAQNSILLSWKAPKDNVGVTGYQIWIGASPSTMTMEQALSSGQSGCILTNLAKGVYYMDVRAVDAAGNASASKPAKITVTTSLPVNVALSSSLDLLTRQSPDQTSFALASGQ